MLALTVMLVAYNLLTYLLIENNFKVDMREILATDSQPMLWALAMAFLFVKSFVTAVVVATGLKLRQCANEVLLL